MPDKSGKFGNLIRQARQAEQPDNQQTVKPDNQQTVKPDDQQTIKPDDQQTIKPDDQQTVKPDSQQTVKPDNQQTVKPDDQQTVKPDSQQDTQEKQVNLCAKVPESWRRHWAGMAKIQGTTMTEVMVEALKGKFGLPENQKTK